VSTVGYTSIAASVISTLDSGLTNLIPDPCSVK